MTQYVKIDMMEYRAARAELTQAQIDKELAQQEVIDLRAELATERKKLDGYAAGWADACAARDALAREYNHLEADREYNASLVMQRDRKLAQARAELAAVKNERDEARDELGFVRQAAQEQSDEVQAHWLSPAEAEGLRRQLAQAGAQVASCRKATEWLWGYYDGNTLTAKPGYEDDIRGAWDDLLVAMGTRAAAKLLERLATLDAAEAALADCGLTGIHDAFDGLADAITQMADHIKELLGQQINRGFAERRLRQEAELAAHVHDKSCTELAQTVRTERAERREAEEHASSLRLMLVNISEVLDEYGVEHYRLKDRDSEGMITRERVRLLCQRAERAEALAAL